MHESESSRFDDDTAVVFVLGDTVETPLGCSLLETDIFPKVNGY